MELSFWLVEWHLYCRPSCGGYWCNSTDVTICGWVGVFDSPIIRDRVFTQAILILHSHLENLYKNIFKKLFRHARQVATGRGEEPPPPGLFLANRSFFHFCIIYHIYKSFFFQQTNPYTFLYITVLKCRDIEKKNPPELSFLTHSQLYLRQG